jgi:hypothetical protein
MRTHRRIDPHVLGAWLGEGWLVHLIHIQIMHHGVPCITLGRRKYVRIVCCQTILEIDLESNDETKRVFPVVRQHHVFHLLYVTNILAEPTLAHGDRGPVTRHEIAPGPLYRSRRPGAEQIRQHHLGNFRLTTRSIMNPLSVMRSGLRRVGAR